MSISLLFSPQIELKSEIEGAEGERKVERMIKLHNATLLSESLGRSNQQ